MRKFRECLLFRDQSDVRLNRAKLQHGVVRLDKKQQAGCFFLDKSSCLLLSNAEHVFSISALPYVSGNSCYERFFLRKSDVESSRQDQTQLDSASENKTNKPITSDAERRLFHVQFKRLY